MNKNRYECTKNSRQSCRYNNVNPIGYNRDKRYFSRTEKKGFVSKMVAKVLELSRLKKNMNGASGNQRDRSKEAV